MSAALARLRLMMVVVLLGAGLVACSSSSAKPASTGSSTGGSGTEFSKPSGTVRGFDGTTIKLGGIGIKSQLPTAEDGARARVLRFNNTNEIPGVKLDYVDFADDNNDPATALSQARLLVARDQVFAITGDISANNPRAYFEQQKVPYFGWAFDNTYCSPEPSTELWGFSISGCLLPDNPTAVPDSGRNIYAYVNKKTRKDHPTLALFSGDSQSGQNSLKLAAAFKGSGFDVVFAKGIIPQGGAPVSDYTPYVQQLLTSDDGKAPDSIVCLAATDCIPVYTLLQANNYAGTYSSPLYSPLLVSTMKGSTIPVYFVPFDEPSPALTQMQDDVNAVKANSTLDLGSAVGYFSTDMFIQNLKKVVSANGKAYISPENIQKAASTATWELKGLMGPTKYPESTVRATPSCNALIYSTGTEFKTVEPYNCSSKIWPVDG